MSTYHGDAVSASTFSSLWLSFCFPLLLFWAMSYLLCPCSRGCARSYTPEFRAKQPFLTHLGPIGVCSGPSWWQSHTFMPFALPEAVTHQAIQYICACLPSAPKSLYVQAGFRLLRAEHETSNQKSFQCLCTPCCCSFGEQYVHLCDQGNL